MSATIDIRALEGAELEAARSLLTDNFMQDPTIEWMLQKEINCFNERVKMHMDLAHQFFIDAKMPIMGAWVNGDLRGVLYGGPIDGVHMQEADHHFIDKIKNTFTGTTLERVLDYEESINDEILPHTYFLALMAVAQHARGRGIGSALVKHVIEMCKANTAIERIMLDTANIRNIDLYERLGFKTTAIKAFDENFCQTVMLYSLRPS